MSYESLILDEQTYGGLPVAHWPCSETAGVVAADVFGVNNATLVDSPTLNVQPGPINRGPGGWVSLNGSSQYLNLGTLGTLGANLANGLTIECWLKSSVTNASMTVFGVVGASLKPFIKLAVNTDYNGLVAAGHIRVACFDLSGGVIEESVLSDTGITNGAAHHLVATIYPSTKTTKIFADGVQATSSSAPFGTLTTWANFPVAPCWGCQNNNGTFQQFFNGQIAQAALYNYVLAADRVKAHYLAANSLAFAMSGGTARILGVKAA